MYEKLGMDKTTRIAVLVSNIETKAEELHFYENVCLNRGWHIRIFTDRDAAIEWLTGN